MELKKCPGGNSDLYREDLPIIKKSRIACESCGHNKNSRLVPYEIAEKDWNESLVEKGRE